MKTVPLALLSAVAAWAGAAAAQSDNVTLYGIVDQQVIKMNDSTSLAANPGAGGNNQWNLKHGAQPRLGFRGQEGSGSGRRRLEEPVTLR
jgi:predicted porin